MTLDLVAPAAAAASSPSAGSAAPTPGPGEESGAGAPAGSARPADAGAGGGSRGGVSGGGDRDASIPGRPPLGATGAWGGGVEEGGRRQGGGLAVVVWGVERRAGGRGVVPPCVCRAVCACARVRVCACVRVRVCACVHVTATLPPRMLSHSSSPLLLVRCGAVRCGAVRCGAVRCGAVRCGAGWGRDASVTPHPAHRRRWRRVRVGGGGPRRQGRHHGPAEPRPGADLGARDGRAGYAGLRRVPGGAAGAARAVRRAQRRNARGRSQCGGRGWGKVRLSRGPACATLQATFNAGLLGALAC